MGKYQYECTRIELDEKLRNCMGKTLGECDKANVFNRAKSNPKITGIAGDVVEQSIIGYAPNSDSNPDLIVDGIEIELKTTGLRASKKVSGFEAKEPMSITAVSIDNIVDEEFEWSGFWHKAKSMLIVYYLYDSDHTVSAIEYASFPLKGYQFHEFSDDEVAMLKADWTKVRDFLRDVRRWNKDKTALKDGYAALSSELRHDLMLIDTAPKYPHPPRFRLKRSTVTAIARKCFGGGYEQLPETYTTYDEIDGKLRAASIELKGCKVGEICKAYGIAGAGKNVCEQVVSHIFGGTSKKMSNIELFAKIGLTAKSVVLTKSGARTEDMKLFTIDFDEFTSRTTVFDESLFYEYFSNNQIICIVLEEPSAEAPLSENVFLGFKRLVFDEAFIEEEVKPVWTRIGRLIRFGELRDDVVYSKVTREPIINPCGTVRSAPNFPKSSEGNVFVRGTSSDSRYKPECVNGVRMYKQQVWIKGKYVAEMLANTTWI